MNDTKNTYEVEILSFPRAWEARRKPFVTIQKVTAMNEKQAYRIALSNWCYMGTSCGIGEIVKVEQ